MALSSWTTGCQGNVNQCFSFLWEWQLGFFGIKIIIIIILKKWASLIYVFLCIPQSTPFCLGDMALLLWGLPCHAQKVIWTGSFKLWENYRIYIYICICILWNEMSNVTLVFWLLPWRNLISIVVDETELKDFLRAKGGSCEANNLLCLSTTISNMVMQSMCMFSCSKWPSYSICMEVSAAISLSFSSKKNSNSPRCSIFMDPVKRIQRI